MPRCTHQGCGQEFDEAANAEGSCSYHPGGPVRPPPPLHLTTDGRRCSTKASSRGPAAARPTSPCSSLTPSWPFPRVPKARTPPRLLRSPLRLRLPPLLRRAARLPPSRSTRTAWRRTASPLNQLQHRRRRPRLRRHPRHRQRWSTRTTTRRRASRLARGASAWRAGNRGPGNQTGKEDTERMGNAAITRKRFVPDAGRALRS